MVLESPQCEEVRLGELDPERPRTEHHFVRSHFPTPRLTGRNYRVDLSGTLDRPRAFGLEELRRLRVRSLEVTMECAGNSRTSILPSTGGVRWGDGAVGTARWTGVSLRDVLRGAGLSAATREIVLEGADSGLEPGAPAVESYAMSLPTEKALDPDTLLAWEMNGRPLRPEHGFPLRAIVPGYYGMASVKWLRRIVAVDQAFEGYFRAHAYTWIPEGHAAGRRGRPVGPLNVKSLITRPGVGAQLRPGRVELAGVAWSSGTPIDRVEVRAAAPGARGPGSEWTTARLGRPRGRYAWVPWSAELVLDRPGHYLLRARARDAGGRTQPARPRWNLRGVETHAVHTIPITILPEGA